MQTVSGRRPRAVVPGMAKVVLRTIAADAPACTNVLRTTSVNSAECVAFVRACAPDFMLARCKTLLKPAVFTVPPGGTYVLHPGICPEYRNAHGCFWALACGDLSRVGLTLLLIPDQSTATSRTRSTSAKRATS